MTLAGLHREFLRHCEAEKRLAPQTIIAYRSDFAQFLTYLLEGRPGRGRPDSLRAFPTAGLRDYQRHMAIVALQDIPDCDADLTLPCTPFDALASIVSALEVRRQALTVVPMRSVIASSRGTRPLVEGGGSWRTN